MGNGFTDKGADFTNRFQKNKNSLSDRADTIDYKVDKRSFRNRINGGCVLRFCIHVANNNFMF